MCIFSTFGVFGGKREQSSWRFLLVVAGLVPAIPIAGHCATQFHSEQNMANGGWYGTAQDRERIEGPLKLLDPELDRFASKYGLQVTKNLKDWPERSLVWGTDVRCLIQVFLVDESGLTLNLWICASQDRDGSRFWKKETSRKEVQVSEMARDLFDLLEAGKRKLDHCSAHPEELEFATKLGHQKMAAEQTVVQGS